MPINCQVDCLGCALGFDHGIPPEPIVEVEGGSLREMDPFQWEEYMLGNSEARPVKSYGVQAPGHFVRSRSISAEQLIENHQAYKPMTLHEMAFWGMAPKSCLGKHY